MEQTCLAQLFKSLGEPVRLQILSMLPITRDCESVYNVSELARELGIPQPSVSHHLKILHQAGLVQSARMCRDVYYWINAPVVAAALSAFQSIIHTTSETSDTP